MILVDTSVWIDHLRAANEVLNGLPGRAEALTHPFVIGEVAMGNITRRGVVIAELRKLPSVRMASDHEVILLIERNRLFGIGIGYIDAHVLATTVFAENVTLWTLDRRLRAAAARLGVAAPLSH